MQIAKLVPEFEVTDLDASLAFYVTLLQFSVAWTRPEERFAYLERDGAQLMLEEATGPGRRIVTAALERPFGRGVNLQIEVSDVGALYARVIRADCQLVVPLEERSYRTGATSVTQRQFVVADPDGYLLRFCSDRTA